MRETSPSPSLSAGSSRSSSIFPPSPSVQADSLLEDANASERELLRDALAGLDILSRGSAQLDPTFMSRVSQLPLVNGGLDLYQRTKASSRVVKYGAGIVESSLSTISRPLAGNLNTLDDFACRQLDRFVPISPTPTSTSQTNDSRTEVPIEKEDKIVDIPRSTWQNVLLEAGGLGAAVSEESLKSLRYCLEWLIYATAHLDHQIVGLKKLISSLQEALQAHVPAQSTALLHASTTAHLASLKHDVIETIRKVVDVVSTYAGAALPEQAKRYVKQAILGLPVKWASAIDARTQVKPENVPELLPGVEREGVIKAKQSADVEKQRREIMLLLKPTEEAAERILTFAVESLDMLRSLTQIFQTSMEKAEAWIERLRVVGIDRARTRTLNRGSTPVPADCPSTEGASEVGAKRPRPLSGEWSQNSLSESVTPSELLIEKENNSARRRKPARSREHSSTPTPSDA